MSNRKTADKYANREYDEYTLYSTNNRNEYHLMKINNPTPNFINNLDNPTLERKRDPMPQDDDDMDIDADGVKKEGEETFDPTKVAGNPIRTKGNFFKKKTKTYFFGRDGDKDDKNDGISVLGNSHKKDPDAIPWVLSDSKMSMEGTLEGGAQSSNYVYFMLSDHGFEVIPGGKWYKFTKTSTHQKLTLEEAEAKIAKQTRGMKSQDRWMMHRLKKEADQAIDDPDFVKTEKTEQYMRSQKLKVADNDADSTKFNEQQDGLDFEEDFQDDDGLMLFGFDDEEDIKEATKRSFGSKAIATTINFEDEDEDVGLKSKNMDKFGKKLKNSLIKLEKADILESDEEDPYADSEEEEEEIQEKEKSSTIPVKPSEEKATPANLLLKSKLKNASKAQAGSKSNSRNNSRESSPVGAASSKKKSSASPDSRESSMSPNARKVEDKRKRDDDVAGSDIKKIKLTVSPNSPPPPPTAAEVIREKRKSTARGGSTSPPYSNSPSPTYTAASSPRQISPKNPGSSSSPPSTDPISVRVQADVIKVLKAHPGITVKELVSQMTELITLEDKSIFKTILKKVSVYDKEKKTVTLKDNYK